jgi:hypothetical protein
MDGVGDVAASHHAVLRTTQAADLGLLAPHVDQLKRQAALREPVPGVLVVNGSVPTWRQRLAIVTSAVHGNAVISHRSAAALHQLDGFDDGMIEVTVGRGELAHLTLFVPELVRHQVSTELPAGDVHLIDGLRCTSLARTLVDLPAVVDDRRIEQALDDYERKGYSLTWLEQVAHRLRRPGHRGPKLILGEIERRRLRGRVRGSWMEKLIAECLASSLLPPLAQQHVIRDSAGGFVATVDLAFPSLRLALEGHSRSFHAAVGDGWVDERRENRGLIAGWQFAYLGWSDTTTPQRTCRFIEELAATRARDLGLGDLPLAD